VALVVLLANCANPKGITGGPKDTIPPKVVKMIPANKTTNFTSRVIILEMDEWIKLNNLQKELLITPSIKGNYKVIDSKKRVVLEFEKPFDPNTTYTFNFRKAIGDITEGNPVKDLQLVFSTGDKLDSLQIAGKATDILENTPASDCSVWLAPTDDTLKVQKHLPYYLGRTDGNGNFRLQNLKAGKYLLYVFKDKNGNNILNPDQENVGFLTSEVDLTQKNVDSLEIAVAPSDKKAPKIMRARPSNSQTDKAFIDFSKGIRKVSIESSPKIAYQIAETGKEVMLFNTEKVYDSLALKIVAEDSLGNTVEDTKKVLFLKELRSGKPKKEPFKMQVINKSQGEGILHDFAIEIAFSKPIAKEDTSKIRFQKDKDSTAWIGLQKSDYQWNEYRNKLTIEKKIIFKEELRLQIDTMAFESVEQEYSPKSFQKYALKNPTKFGIVKLTLETTKTDLIIELLDDKKKVVRQIKELPKNKTIIWDYLPAGTYTVRAIIDANKNGRWDMGDYEKRIQPEKVVFLPKEIPLRENWEITEKFVIE
jgi:hypothetical protein